LRNDAVASGARRTILGNSLVVGQLAVSLLLLVAAGLFMRALDRGSRVDPGFDSGNVAVASFNTDSWGYDEAKGRAFFRALRERLEHLPGVSALSYTMHLPLTMHNNGDNIQVDGTSATTGSKGTEVPVWLANVDAQYFDALKIPIVGGRALDANDDERATKTAVVNETLARRYWPDGSAVGRTIRYQGDQVTIVGIARDAKYSSLTETTPPFVYFPMAQHWQKTQVLLLRTAAGPDAVGPAIDRAVRAIDPALPRPTVSTLRQENSIVLLPQRVAAMVTGALGVVGLLLATVGLYGIIAYSVGRRTREIGVRVALGARRSDVLRMIVREGMLLAGIGVVIGLVLATAVTRLIAGFLFSVSPMDGVTFAAMSLLFVAVALVASYLPARRAAASDPVAALRSD
jgi:predicted permease